MIEYRKIDVHVVLAACSDPLQTLLAEAMVCTRKILPSNRRPMMFTLLVQDHGGTVQDSTRTYEVVMMAPVDLLVAKRHCAALGGG